MNPVRLVVGLAILFIGLLFLGVNIGWWSPAVWMYVVQFWPVLLIIYGVALLLRNAIATLIVALGLLLLLGWSVSTGAIHSRTQLPFGMVHLNESE